jgi:mannosyltransferase
VQVAGKRMTKYGVALLAIILISVFLRLYHLGTQSIWYDEAFSVQVSKLAVSQTVQAAAADVHPPLYYVLLHYWITVFGISELSVRLLSALFGVLAIPMIYVLGRQLFSEEAGLVAALILALSSFNIWYSQETRMYTLMVLLTLLSMYFFLQLLQWSTLASSAGYVLSTTLLVYTHNYGWFVVIAQNIYVASLLLLSRRRTHKLRRWIMLQAIVLALFVPWMASFVKQVVRSGAATWLGPPTLATIFQTFSRYSGTTVLLALFLGLSVLSLFAYQKVCGSMDWKAPLKALESYSWQVRIQDAASVYFLSVWLLTINLIPFTLSRFSTPVYFDRYTIAASVALYLLVAKGTVNIQHRYTKLAVIGIIVILSAANLQVYYTSITRPQVREATSLIDANIRSGDVVLVAPSWDRAVFDYYNNRTDIVVKPMYSWAVANQTSSFWATASGSRPEDKIKEIQTDVNGHDRVWLLAEQYADGKAAEDFTLNILNGSYSNIYKKCYYGYDVYLFEKHT